VERRTGGLPSVQDTNCTDTGDFDRDGRQDFLSCSYSLRLYRNRTSRSTGVLPRGGGAPEPSDPAVERRRTGQPEPRPLAGPGDRLQGAVHVRLNRQQVPHFPEVDFRFPLSAGFSFCRGRANGDAAADLLVVQRLVSPNDRIQRREWMFVNSGAGNSFRALPVPQPPRGNRRNGNGRLRPLRAAPPRLPPPRHPVALDWLTRWSS
jgi:hypothetical protein